MIAKITEAIKPLGILSFFPAPIFCAVKFDIPLPQVVKLVIVNVFNLIAAEYPAITEEP